MNHLNLCEQAFLCGMGAGACALFVAGVVVWSLLDAVRAFREGSNDE